MGVYAFQNGALNKIAGNSTLNYESSPVGCLTGFMGTTPPENWLACDGSVYDVKEYPELADLFEKQLGSADVFGEGMSGEGKFKIPDLQGEFLRGIGANSHGNQGSGGEVGEHQDSTTIPWFGTYNQYGYIAEDLVKSSTNYYESSVKNPDIVPNTSVKSATLAGTIQDMSIPDRSSNYGIRPTNTSVLWIIKAKTPDQQNDYFDFLDSFATVEMRRNNFRGKYLGNKLTKEQAQRIADGTFRGFFVGDYWKIDGRIWRIVDINYWIGTGDAECVTPHLVIMPDRILYKAKMNSANTTEGGYVGSEMYQTGLDEAKNIIHTVFGEGNILNHQEWLSTSVNSDGQVNGGGVRSSTIELPNEIELYGCLIYASLRWKYSFEKNQLSLMRINPKFINISRETYWIRDVASSTTFASMLANGYTDHYYSNNERGVRPVFGLTG